MLGCDVLVGSFRLYTQTVASVLRYLIPLVQTDAAVSLQLCLPDDNDETRLQSVARTAVDSRVFSLVLMCDGGIISALLTITNTLILVEVLFCGITVFVLFQFRVFSVHNFLSTMTHSRFQLTAGLLLLLLDNNITKYDPLLFS